MSRPSNVARLLEPAQVREWLFIGTLKNGDGLYQNYETPYYYKIDPSGGQPPQYYTLVGIEYPPPTRP